MNRRGFLSLFAAAPVAVPLAAKTAFDEMAMQSIVGEAFIGIDGAGLRTEFQEAWDEAMHPLERLASSAIEDQMIEHDLFDPSPFRVVTGNTENRNPIEGVTP